MSTEKNNSPLVSVLLPVYNSSAYLASAIDSILKQTFADFELLIINDGSTDNSPEIISSFTDERIKVINNEKNLGLIASLNKGIDLAKGKYIARMDADDISLPERFEKQINYLKSNPTVSVIATRISLINTQGEITGDWDDDKQYIEGEVIKHGMAFTNRIAHPTVMVRAEVFKKYKYKTYQKSSEDWDLWLRILADGHKIHKLNEVFLHYRIHLQSIMTIEKKSAILQQRLIKTKKIFLFHQLPKINSYFFLVFYSLLRSIGSLLKFNVFPNFLRKIKRILTSSPITVMRQYAQLKYTLINHKTELFFFFPYTHVGGAERVHADIVSVFKSQNPLVTFTGFSKNKKFLQKFSENATILDISDALNYPFLHKKTLKLISEHINKQNKPIVFGSNSGYFYDIASYLSPKVKIIDLIHAFKYQSEKNLVQKQYLSVSQKFTNRIFISSASLSEFKKFCFHSNCPKSYKEKLKLIYNYTKVPALLEKKRTDILNVIFVGRDSEEKRIDIFIEIARELYTNHPQKFSFNVIGASRSEKFINYMGEINDDEEMKQHYLNADVLVLTSSREGFPLVIMEAMAQGVIPLSTPVGDIPIHVGEKVGFITSTEERSIVVKEITDKLLWLSQNKTALETLSANAHRYTQTNFSEEKFTQSYKFLFRSE